MKPSDITQQALFVLNFSEYNDKITNDPAELAAVLRSAAESCTQIAQHNTSMAIIQASLEGMNL